MSSAALDPIGPARIDDIQSRAQAGSDRVARAQAPSFALIHAARQPPAASAAPHERAASGGHGGPGEPVDTLRDQYTAHCLQNAIQAFHDRQTMLEALAIAANQAQRDELAELQARASAANDLGTIQGLLPLQPYRFAVGVALVVPPQLVAAASAAPAMVGPVAQTAAPRNATDDAYSADPAARERARNPR